MRNKWNRAAGMRDNRTVNKPVSILCTGLWSLSETRGCHVLNVVCPYSLWDIWWSEFFQIAMSFQAESSLSFVYVFAFFCTSYQKSRNLYVTNKLFVSKWINLNIWNKKIIMISILPSCNMILLNLHRNIIINFVSFKIFLAIKIYKRKISIISLK